MCYRVHERQTDAQPSGTIAPPLPDRVRTRWVGVAAATLVGGLAMAALVAPSPLLKSDDAGAPARLAAKAGAVPATPVIERTSLPADDGVPTSTDVVKAGLGDCHHGL
jgi:hypothetical protein